MGLKCSLLGHDFGDPEIEREREERGGEVVLISREVETCSRCGEERIVSENKEVTTVQPEADVSGDAESATADSEPGTGTGAGAGTGGAAESPESEPGAGGLESAIEEVESDEGLEPSPEEDDAVILDDEEEPDERGPGEWPEETAEPESELEQETTPAAEESGPEPESEPEPEPEPESADVAESEPSPEAEDAEVWSGEMPGSEPASEEPAGPTLTAESESTVDVESIPEGSFYCPDCGFHEPVAGSSLREGDACPDCHRGYLERKGT